MLSLHCCCGRTSLWRAIFRAAFHSAQISVISVTSRVCVWPQISIINDRARHTRTVAARLPDFSIRRRFNPPPPLPWRHGSSSNSDEVTDKLTNLRVASQPATTERRCRWLRERCRDDSPPRYVRFGGEQYDEIPVVVQR